MSSFLSNTLSWTTRLEEEVILHVLGNHIHLRNLFQGWTCLLKLFIESYSVAHWLSAVGIWVKSTMTMIFLLMRLISGIIMLIFQLHLFILSNFHCSFLIRNMHYILVTSLSIWSTTSLNLLLWTLCV